MVKLVLTEEQTRLLEESQGQATIVDAKGRIIGLGKVSMFTEEEIQEILQRRRRNPNQPRYTTAEVLEHLRARR